MSTIFPFKSIKNKHDVYRGKDFVKKIGKSLREHLMKIINSKKQKHNLLTNEPQKSYKKKSNFCYICKEKFEDKYVKQIS